MSRPPRRAVRTLAMRWLWPPDKWERLSTVASLSGTPGTVLDVGGRGHELSRLLTDARVTTLNVEPPADVVTPPGPLPFPDASFDVVTCTDVLEHVPRDERADLVAELVRVARQRVVLCFPCGSDTKDRAERTLATTLQERFGVRLGFLEEHLALGLPRAGEADAWVGAALERHGRSAHRRTWGYSRGVSKGDQTLVDAMAVRHRGDVRALVRVLRAWLARPDVPIDEVASEDTDRAYLALELA